MLRVLDKEMLKSIFGPKIEGVGLGGGGGATRLLLILILKVSLFGK